MSWLENIQGLVAGQPLLAVAAAFLAGVISSASPCVLSTIPLVVGFVGGYADGNRGKAFRFSLAFVFGLCLTFTAMGAAAGLLGTMFGTLGGWWYLAAGTIAIVMGMQLMGLFEIRLSMAHNFRPKQGGAIASFLLGLISGVVSSPCATPVLVVILTYVAGNGNIIYGITLLFAYAVGHSLLMLLAGTFTGFVEAFAARRSMVDISLWSRRLGGVVVIASGLWLILQS